MIGLSKSALEVFQSCPKCFWMEKIAKVARPRGPMPSVVNAIDLQMKMLVNQQSLMQMEIKYLGRNKLVPFQDRAKVEQFRSWRTFQRVIEIGDRHIKAWGELDDLLFDEKTGLVWPWDFKSKGTAPDQAYCEKYNQNQGDMYHLLLEGQGLKCSGMAKFTYVWPEWDAQNLSIEFRDLSIDMETDPQRAMKILEAAAACLEGPCPKEGALDCEYCSFIIKRKEH